MDIGFHNTFHGLWAGLGVGNASLEANMIQQLTATRETVLYKIFLDLQKTYNALYM